MTTRLPVVICLTILLSFAHAASDIPAFTPNVVDPHAYLTESEKDELNRLIQEVRTRADIHAAIYLVQALVDESIEELAERAFRVWTLGQAGKDNGLLIILAMNDRKMRIETGYGLEGDIPDAVARRVLDEQLRPFLRANQIRNGLAAALVALAQRRNKDYVPSAELGAPAPALVDASAEAPLDLRSAFLWWGAFALLILGVHPIWARLVGRKKSKLVAADPGLSGSVSLKPSERSLLKAFTTGWAVKLFLIVNPGIFIFVFAMLGEIDREHEILWAAGVSVFLILMYWLATRKYASPAAFQEYLAAQAAKHEAHMKRLVEIGHARLEPGGRYAYTQAYYESERARARSNSSSSFSSRSSSSSSGGGSSGGGGASSSW